MQTCGKRFIRETQPGIAFEKETDSLHLFQEIDLVHGFAAVVNLIDNDQKWKSAQCMFDLVFGRDQCALALELNVAKPDDDFKVTLAEFKQVMTKQREAKQAAKAPAP